mgnify:CR=1 FL=1
MKSRISTERIREELAKLLDHTIIEMDNKLNSGGVEDLDTNSIYRLTSQRVIIKQITSIINFLEKEEN